jgi:hypothetical protein
VQCLCLGAARCTVVHRGVACVAATSHGGHMAPHHMAATWCQMDIWQVEHCTALMCMLRHAALSSNMHSVALCCLSVLRALPCICQLAQRSSRHARYMKHLYSSGMGRWMEGCTALIAANGCVCEFMCLSLCVWLRGSFGVFSGSLTQPIIAVVSIDSLIFHTDTRMTPWTGVAA